MSSESDSQTASERACTPPFPIVELEGVESYILQIDEIDPNGESFRYATMKVTKADRPESLHLSIRRDIELGNIGVLGIAMEKLADWLEAIGWWIAELEDAKADILRRHAQGG